MARIERVVVNIENDLRPKVHVLLDADKIRQDDTAELKQAFSLLHGFTAVEAG